MEWLRGYVPCDAETPMPERLAHLAAKQGPRARYRGARRNLFDLRRYAAFLNLEVIERRGRTAMAA